MRDDLFFVTRISSPVIVTTNRHWLGQEKVAKEPRWESEHALYVGHTGWW